MLTAMYLKLLTRTDLNVTNTIRNRQKKQLFLLTQMGVVNSSWRIHQNRININSNLMLQIVNKKLYF